ncbi:MAG: hypothetical protein H7301_11880 [Cryobacterium sp.]|nr:hypothetical protein [Oligoflexia bacterium]
MIPRNPSFIAALSVITGLGLTACGQVQRSTLYPNGSESVTAKPQTAGEEPGESEGFDPVEVEIATQMPEREMTRDEIVAYSNEIEKNPQTKKTASEFGDEKAGGKTTDPTRTPSPNLDPSQEPRTTEAKSDRTRVAPVLLPVVAKKPVAAPSDRLVIKRPGEATQPARPMTPSPVFSTRPWWEPPTVKAPVTAPTRPSAPSRGPLLSVDPTSTPVRTAEVKTTDVKPTASKPAPAKPTSGWPAPSRPTTPAPAPVPAKPTTPARPPVLVEDPNDTGIDEDDERAAETYTGPKEVVVRPLSTAKFLLSETAARLASMGRRDYQKLQYDVVGKKVRACNFFVITALSEANIADDRHLPMFTAGSFDTNYFIPKGWTRITVETLRSWFRDGKSFDVVIQRDPPHGRKNGHIAIPVGLNSAGKIMVAEGVLGRISNRLRLFSDSEVTKGYKIFVRY